MLPLRSVGRSNFVRVCVNLTTLIQKRHILMRTAVLYIYIYIYMMYILIHLGKELNAFKGKILSNRKKSAAVNRCCD